MTRNAPLQLLFLLLLLGCLARGAAAGASGDGSLSWEYDPDYGLYGMYDEVNGMGWVYDPVADVYWKLDLEVGQALGYSMSNSLNYDPSEYYNLFWVSGVTDYELYAYDPYSDQVFVFDFMTGFYWLYLPDPGLAWTIAPAEEVFAGGEIGPAAWEEPVNLEEPVNWEEPISWQDPEISPEPGELAGGVTWHEDENNGFFWSYAPARDIFLVYEPQYTALYIYEPRMDLASYAVQDLPFEGWTYNAGSGVLWGYEPGRDMFWVYYEYSEFLQGYAFSRELYWDVPVQRLNLAGTGSYPGTDAGDRATVSDDNSGGDGSEVVGGLLSLLMIVLLVVALKKRKPKTKKTRDSGSPASFSKNRVGKKSSSGDAPEVVYPPKTWIGKKPPSDEASSQGASAPASGVGGGAEGGVAESKVPASGIGPAEAKSETKSEMKSEMKSEVDSGAKPEADPEVAVGTAAVAGTVAGAGAEPETRSPLEGFPAALLSLYEPLELLGKGGFAAVFKVKRRADEEIVALKIPRIDEKTSSFFIKEVAAWYNLNHPNIVRLYKSDLLPVPYLEMELVEGVDHEGRQVRELDQYPKPLPEAGALKLIRGIAAGLSHAHSRGIFHHDLKPLNILLNSDLSPKITDFGLAKIGARNSLTTHNAYSPLYAAPEQLDEEMYGKPDQRTDIYQLGLVFYELLAGKLPYSGCSMGALLGKIVSKEVKPAAISKTDPALGRYDGVFEKLLAQEKADRYQDVSEFLSALDALERLDREEEEMKKSLEKTKQTLKLSTSREEIERMTREVVEKTSKVALLYARVNEKPELLQALEDLGDYAGENRAELDSAVSQLEYMIRNGVPLGKEFEEGLKVLLGRIEGAAGKE